MISSVDWNEFWDLSENIDEFVEHFTLTILQICERRKQTTHSTFLTEKGASFSLVSNQLKKIPAAQPLRLLHFRTSLPSFMLTSEML